MKKEIKKNEKNSSEVNVLRAGFDNYVPAQEICEFFQLEFKGIEENIQADLKVSYQEIVKKDGTKKNMICIHLSCIEKYIDILKNEYNIKAGAIVRFLIGVHRYHIKYEEELASFLN